MATSLSPKLEHHSSSPLLDLVQVTKAKFASFRLFLELHYHSSFSILENYKTPQEPLSKQELARICERISLKIREKRRYGNNWNKCEIKLLINMVALYMHKKQISNSNFMTQLDWAHIGDCFPGRSARECKFKLLGLKQESVKEHGWEQEQNQILLSLVEDPSNTDWVQISKQLYQRNKNPLKIYRTNWQCKSNYCYNLDPSLLKHKNWTPEEDKSILSLYALYGKISSKMTKDFKGRTQNSVKNRLRYLLKRQLQTNQSKPKESCGMSQLSNEVMQSEGMVRVFQPMPALLHLFPSVPFYFN